MGDGTNLCLLLLARFLDHALVLTFNILQQLRLQLFSFLFDSFIDQFLHTIAFELLLNSESHSFFNSLGNFLLNELRFKLRLFPSFLFEVSLLCFLSLMKNFNVCWRMRT